MEIAGRLKTETAGALDDATVLVVRRA